MKCRSYLRFFILGTWYLVLLTASVFAQVSKVITLDSVTVEATKRGFDVNDFVDWVQHDTTFYKAFKNLHFYPYRMNSTFTAYDKSQKEKATLQRKGVQKVSSRKRWIIIEEENTTGKIYKKKKQYNYYTAELFDYIFFPKDTLVATNIISANDLALQPDAKKESNIDKLKTLMFNPGAKVGGVPLIGNKMAVFDEKMVKHYDYKILSDTLDDSIPCYVFSCKAKQTDENETDDKAVIKELSTWFDKRTLNVMKRNYTLLYSSIFFDFDVTMKVNLEQINGALVPVHVIYDGFWDIPFKKPEIVKFEIWFSEFEIL